MTPGDAADYPAVNRGTWSRKNAEFTDARAAQAWQQPEITWGVWGIPEATVGALPEVAGLDVIELGCGTGYFGSWLKRRGARRVVGVDITPAQLATARRVNDEAGLGLGPCTTARLLVFGCGDIPHRAIGLDVVDGVVHPQRATKFA